MALIETMIAAAILAAIPAIAPPVIMDSMPLSIFVGLSFFLPEKKSIAPVKTPNNQRTVNTAPTTVTILIRISI